MLSFFFSKVRGGLWMILPLLALLCSAQRPAAAIKTFAMLRIRVMFVQGRGVRSQLLLVAVQNHGCHQEGCREEVW